jgi:hypothetical protein
VGEGEEPAGARPDVEDEGISGTAVPRKTQPTMPFFDVFVGQ